MAKYKILRLNKMTSGTHRGLIDMDIQLCSMARVDVTLLKGTGLEDVPSIAVEEAGIMTETGKLSHDISDCICDCYESQKTPIAQETDYEALMLNETQSQVSQQSLTADLTANPPDAVQVISEEQLSAYDRLKEIEKYNQNAQTMHVVYEFEKDGRANECAALSDVSRTLLPLNDILDLCIKSRFKKMSVNYNVPRCFDEDQKLSYNVDQWLVLDRYPADFCQCGNDAFVVTQLMDTQPWRLKTDIEDHIASSYDSYAWKLASDPIQTVLYPSPEELGFKSYREFLDNAKDKPTAAAQLFVQQRKIHGVSYNYIVALDQTSRASHNETIYDNGDIFGYFTTAKNMYNALYSIDMPDASTMQNCRQYCGLQRSRGRVMLKYYDSIDYSISGSKASQSSSSSLVPYQKVEFFQPCKMSAVTKHKSNLFSVVLKNTGLDDGSTSRLQSDSLQRQTAENLRKDIVNGIKSIVDNVAPANTQLFDAQFI